ncbi:MAG: hypothetical protein RR415_04115 [Ruthenibacterium sp.]
MKRILPKLALLFLPIAVYLAVFVCFEPNNYFNLRKNGSDNSPIARIRAYEKNPLNNLILGDSRMAHFDMALVEESAGAAYANAAYGGASLEESIDEFYYLYAQNPAIQNVVFGLSFYTLNNNYRTQNRMKTVETQLQNPAAYVFNLEYNLNALTVLSDTLARRPDVEETAEHTPADYVDDAGAPLPYRKDLIAYTDTLQPICKNYAVNEAALDKLLALTVFCADRQIQLTLVFPPMDESVRALVCVPNGIDAALAPVLQTLQNSGAQVLDYEWTRDPHYDDTQYFDGFHLDTKYGLPIWTKTLFSEVAAWQKN